MDRPDNDRDFHFPTAEKLCHFMEGYRTHLFNRCCRDTDTLLVKHISEDIWHNLHNKMTFWKYYFLQEMPTFTFSHCVLCTNKVLLVNT